VKTGMKRRNQLSVV